MQVLQNGKKNLLKLYNFFWSENASESVWVSKLNVEIKNGNIM